MQRTRYPISTNTIKMSKHKLDADADPELARHEKKRRKKEKKDRKEALRLQDITPSSTDVTTAESTPAPQNDDESATYTQSSELTTLPQSSIDDYLKSENVQITDPQSSGLRPILAFTQLPADIASSYSSAFAKFQKPSSIQSSAWPFLLSGRDVVGVAETGSGKTLGFGLPLVVRLADLKKKKGIRAVIVAPTRELAIQVFEQIDALCKTVPASKLKATCIYGGTNKDDQRRALGKDTNVIVATPGRLKDFMSDGTIDVSKTRYLVLDEADRMLDKGFEEDIKQIIGAMPSNTKRQTAMFTATWPKSIRELASTFMNTPARITIGRNGTDLENDNGELRANPRIKQVVEVVQPEIKQTRLLQLLKQHTAGSASQDKILVFCLYKKEATRIENFISSRGFNVAGIHGDLSQSAREASLNAFKAGNVTILVATDVAARGLDIPSVKVVVNVTFPLTAEDYVHRIGRTGRAGKDGLAITLFTDHDKPLAGALINVLKGAKQDVPEDLLKFGTTVKKKQHATYGAFYKENDDGKTATKITFDD